jgi:hypothetical protein
MLFYVQNLTLVTGSVRPSDRKFEMRAMDRSDGLYDVWHTETFQPLLATKLPLILGSVCGFKN